MESVCYCKYCKFYTKSVYNMKQHVLTKKHKSFTENTTYENAYICTICEKIYGTKFNASKHIKLKHENIKNTIAQTHSKMEVDNEPTHEPTYEMIKIAMQIDDEKSKMKMIKMILDEKNKISNIYENENEFHKKIAVNAGQIVNKTMNMLTFAMQNFKETPQLEMLDSKTARKLLKHEVDNGKNKHMINNDKIAEYIAKISEAKILPKHLGNTLVSHYKKDDPNHQSVWATDVSRMKFITKTNNGWIKDNNSDIINKSMIVPLLKEVTGVMDEYCKEKSGCIDKMSALEESRYIEVVSQTLNIKSDIRSERLNKAIVKHIAPYFLMQKQLK